MQLRSGTRDTDIFCCPCRADTDRAEQEAKGEGERGTAARAEKVQIIKTAGKAQLVHSSHFATWERKSRLNLSRESLDDKNALSIKKAMRGKARQGTARQLSKLAHVLERREKSPAGFVVVVHVIHTPHCRFTSLCLSPLLLQLPAAQQ